MGPLQCLASMSPDAVGLFISWLLSTYASGEIQQRVRASSGIPTLSILSLSATPSTGTSSDALHITTALHPPALFTLANAWGSVQYQVTAAPLRLRCGSAVAPL